MGSETPPPAAPLPKTPQSRKKRKRAIAVIGTGRIGTVLVRALDRAGKEVLVAGRDHAAAEALAAKCEWATCLPIRKASARCGILILAVPPDACLPVLDHIWDVLPRDAIVVSLTNGVSLEVLGGGLNNPVVKLIPTLAQTVRRGTILVMAGPGARPVHVAEIWGLATLIGRPILIDDADARVASNIAGSGLALGARLAEAFVAANLARSVELTAEDLNAMMAETLGALSELVTAGFSFRAIASGTATPGGVTEAAMNVLNASLPDLTVDIVTESFTRQLALQTGIVRKTS
jgi:pyrroline-5-carboxylate reductase